MTTLTWLAGVAGGWRDPNNWVPAKVPAAGDQLIVVSGAPEIIGGTIESQSISLLGSVSLTVNSVHFNWIENTERNNIIVSGGNDEQPTHAALLSQGNTTFIGSIFVEANGGGSLTINSADNFIFGKKAFLLVSQESHLAFTGATITNDGVINVEGASTIAEGVDFLGKGNIQLDNGGSLDVEGAIGGGQAVEFTGAGKLTIGNIADFDARVELTDLGGERIVLEDLRVRSVSYDEGLLTLYSGKDRKGDIEATLKIGETNPAGFPALGSSQHGIESDDFLLKRDGDGGTIITYAPEGPSMLEASLPVPVVASLGSEVSLKSIYKAAFGTRHPDFHGVTLLPAIKTDPSDPNQGYWGQAKINKMIGLESGWVVNGELITAPTKIHKGDTVSFLVGNNIGYPPQIKAQVTKKGKGAKAEYVTYDVWAVDPAVTAKIPATPGHPTPDDILASAAAFQAVYGTPANPNLCNWIADDVAAAAGATMPLPNADLDPSGNVEGGFWRIAYRGSDTDTPVDDWNTIVQPGDIVRLEWGTDGTGHTTTVLAVNSDGSLTVYDNIDFIENVHHIGEHDDVNYWKTTDPAGITIYRLDPAQQYLINGTKLGEFMQGSVFDDLVHGRGGADRIKGSIGDDEIRGARGKDHIFGQAGDDLLVGGRLGDRLKGGPGDDTFAYEHVRDSKPGHALRDVIRDFSHRDLIDLSEINQRLDAKGKVPFHFIGEKPFGGHPGELNYWKKSGHKLVVEGDRDGDGRADFAIKVTGVGHLVDTDFVF